MSALVTLSSSSRQVLTVALLSSHCGGEFVECQFNSCAGDCANATNPTCMECLNQGVPSCTSALNSCMQGSTPAPVTVKLLVGNVNLNQAASDLNAQIVGASVGVLCGFTALLVLISMTGMLG